MQLRPAIAGGLAAMLAVPLCVLAAGPEPAQPVNATFATAPRPAPGAAPAADAPAASPEQPDRAASPAELDGLRGGHVSSAAATVSGTLDGNSAAQVATGNNVIQSGSFANAAGLPVVIQNSGANVLIQNATVINLELK